MVTVTMSIKEYEKMKSEIKQLKKESVFNFVETEYIDFMRNLYQIKVDVNSIRDFVSSKAEKDVNETVISEGVFYCK